VNERSRPADLSRVRLCLIWAQDLNGAIGVRNTLPWHAPEDLAHFKRLTQGHPVVMGRKTWESLPKKPLPGRLNLVVSRQDTESADAAVRWCTGLEDALRAACAWCRPVQGPCPSAFAPHSPASSALHDCTVFIIGGAQLYKEALDWANEVYITKVGLVTPDADAFAPALGPDWGLAGPALELPSAKGMLLAFEHWKKRHSS